MSQHHARSGWATISARYRPAIKASLPAPCVNRCTMGGTVLPGQAFDVAHIVDVAAGGSNARHNLGAAHQKCNRSDGGKLGAAKTNAAKRAALKVRKW